MLKSKSDPYTESWQFSGMVGATSLEAGMDQIVFIGAPHETPFFKEAGALCFEPAPGHLVERVVAEQERCSFLVMTRETFTALPPWLARDLLVWKPGQVFVVSQLPHTCIEKHILLDELRRKAARAMRSVA